MMPRSFTTERAETAIQYLDVYNVFWAARTYYGAPPDFGKILQYVKSHPSWLAKAFIPDNGRASRLRQVLATMGYQVFTKPGRYRPDGRLKANFDVEITIAALDDLYQLRPRVVYLVTGDSDFVPLVHRLRQEEVAITVMAFAEGLASDLRNAADRVILLDQRSLLVPRDRRNEAGLTLTFEDEAVALHVSE